METSMKLYICLFIDLNITICDTFVHEQRVFSHNLNYLKHLIKYVTHNVYNFGGSLLQ